MKKVILFSAILSLLMMSACKKDEPVNNSTSITLRYEFTADTVATYSVGYTADTLQYNEDVAAQSWSKTITLTKVGSQVDSASIEVFAPPSWQGTNAEANATVKIFVNNVEKASNSGVLSGFDRPVGLSTVTAY